MTMSDFASNVIPKGRVILSPVRTRLQDQIPSAIICKTDRALFSFTMAMPGLPDTSTNGASLFLFWGIDLG